MGNKIEINMNYDEFRDLNISISECMEELSKTLRRINMSYLDLFQNNISPVIESITALLRDNFVQNLYPLQNDWIDIWHQLSLRLRDIDVDEYDINTLECLQELEDRIIAQEKTKKISIKDLIGWALILVGFIIQCRISKPSPDPSLKEIADAINLQNQLIQESNEIELMQLDAEHEKNDKLDKILKSINQALELIDNIEKHDQPHEK